jgi:Ca2+-binding EF-hand superfamily protein
MQKRTTLISLAIAAFFGASIVASAQTTTAPAKTPKTAEQKAAGKASYEAKFKAADKNSDGGLSKDELAAAGGEFGAIQKHFTEMDTNKDGKISMDEHKAWMKAHRAEKKKAASK